MPSFNFGDVMSYVLIHEIHYYIVSCLKDNNNNFFKRADK